MLGINGQAEPRAPRQTDSFGSLTMSRTGTHPNAKADLRLSRSNQTKSKEEEACAQGFQTTQTG